MKYLKYPGFVLLFIIVALAIFIVNTSGKKIVFNLEPEFEYSALTEVENGKYEKFHIFP